MGRIFISAAHGGKENGLLDPGAMVAGTTEAQEMILLRDLVVSELRTKGVEVLSVPDDLSFRQSLDWINVRGRANDVAIELHADSANNPSVRGATSFYIADNDTRKKHANLLLAALTKRLPKLPSQGAKPDSTAGLGSLAFCRLVKTPSLVLQVGFLTNPDDRFILQNQRREMAAAIADGLIAWLDDVSGGVNVSYAPISIEINGQNYGEQGIIVSGNAYIPIDLVDRLGFDLASDENVRRVSYRNVVFVRAIELKPFDVSVGWEAKTRTVILRTISKLCTGQKDRIMGHGNASEVQLMMFLKSRNPKALEEFSMIARHYRNEGEIEGVNYDLAFCQMCWETNFLRFGDLIVPAQNNFASIGAISGPEGATFPNVRTGVRAHIQQLKAYATTQPLVNEVVSPRFRFITRGVAPLFGQLSGRWNADLSYGTKVLNLVTLLYEDSGLIAKA
ncbi:N-acetylmuramoyl-L-alanine amidase [filamentous cyanobacterium LEGE 11480]|uniref:N-acetylmuramoyl-L-alanine amidase n=1 Tax=Romeriopsis navalis LEGE 11480 TaxID=2777977 RepID=A0A928VVB0_9CYAN|nr:N-acetylmuramoyl-L-alanine amidase [Romeriopsis navalis]MBE9032879.1 N-acetylmuramoyl-L-alanine amidase [Romeriopsis navalis LEGE 11480]